MVARVQKLSGGHYLSLLPDWVPDKVHSHCSSIWAGGGGGGGGGQTRPLLVPTSGQSLVEHSKIIYLTNLNR